MKAREGGRLTIWLECKNVEAARETRQPANYLANKNADGMNDIVKKGGER